MNDNLAYKQNTADGYEKFSEDEFEGDKSLFKTLKKISIQNKDVLDYGCGNGRLIKRFLSFSPNKIVGVDVSKPMIEKAQEMRSTLPQPEKLEFMSIEGTELTFRDSEFDIVLAHFVLHYIVDTRAILKELYRVLRPGGQVILTLNDFSFKKGCENLTNTVVPLILKNSLRIESLAKPASEIINNATEAGFTIESQESFPTFSATIPPEYPHLDKIIYKNRLIVLRK